MRRFLSSAIILLYTVVFIFSPLVSAQAGEAPMFELIVPATARANEAFDVTVKALNPDGTINTTYEGGIYFSVTPDSSGATIPANIESSDAEFKFALSEQGQHTFSKAFIFSKDGSYEITVTDNDTFEEVMKPITITSDGTTTTGPITVTITEPVPQDTVNASSVIIAGMTKPTSTVNFFLGTQKKSQTISDTSGGFSGTVSGLAEGPNTLKVEVMDGSGKVAGSATVTVNYSLDAPKINSLTLKEGNQVFAGSTVHLEAVGDPGLKTVIVQFGDQSAVLEEDSTRPGIYTGTAKISSFEGEIKPIVNAESFQGTRGSFSDLLNVNVISSSFENVKVAGEKDQTTNKNIVRFTFSLKSNLEEIMYFKIKYGLQPGQYDKEVITSQKTQMKEGDQYTWYIPELETGEYYSTIVALDKDKKELLINSGEQMFSLVDFPSAETCYIDKVSGVTVKMSGSKSIISWDKLDDAASYQIFKKDSDGEYAMIDEVMETTYTVNIDMSSEEEVFEDFQIRATCKNGDITGEGAYSESVSVQTGPAAIALMMLMIASGVAFILMKRGYLR